MTDSVSSPATSNRATTCSALAIPLEVATTADYAADSGRLSLQCSSRRELVKEVSLPPIVGHRHRHLSARRKGQLVFTRDFDRVHTPIASSVT